MLIKFLKLRLSALSIAVIFLLSGCLANNPPETEESPGSTTDPVKTADVDSETGEEPALEKATSSIAVNKTVPEKPAKPPVTSTEPVLPQQGGIQQVSGAQLQTLLNDGVILVDIRRPEEWDKTGVIKGSELLTFFDTGGVVMPSFFRKVTDIVPKGKPIALICDSGSRTRVASEMMARAGGYGTIYNVEKGINAWIKEGREIAKVSEQ